MVRRSLPIGVIPQPGEVLESWSGTLAARLEMTFGEFLFGLRSPMAGIDLRRPGLSVYLTNLEAAAIATRVPQYTEVSGTPDFVDRMSAGALHDVDPTTESDAAPM